jgi:HK97 family phage major capsid protein
MTRAFPGSGPEVEARYERSAQWLLATVWGRKTARDWCERKGVMIKAATGEGIGSQGGFLVPVELENAILDLRDTYGAVRRRARVWPMASDVSKFPRRVATGGAAGYFFAEGAAATATQFVADSVDLTAKKLGAIVTLSNELDMDSAYDLVDYVANELAWAFALKEDDAAFNGDGTSTYAGISGVGYLALDGNHATAKVTASHNTYAALTETDWAALMAQVRVSALPRAAWFVSVTGFGLGMLTGVSGAFLDRGIVDGVSTPYFNGFPVIFTQKLPLVSSSLSGKMMAAFGSLYDGAVLGQRRGITIARSDQRYLDTDQLAILGTERIDIVNHDMGDNSLAGSMAVLVGP